MPLNPWKDFRTKSDANGQKSAAYWKTTYYIRDAQGNPMATYSRSSQNQEASYTLTERPMYGSSRVGIDNYSLEFIGYSTSTSRIYNHVLGLKQYELSNHLGNVLTTISDKKFPIDNNGLIDHYVADITSVSDYYPFGSPMDGRTFGSEKYRYGFNTQEKVDEVYGKGNLNTALFWEYDTRLGRRWNLDPEPQINISDYACFANNPIVNVDWLGDKWGEKGDEASQKDNETQAMEMNDEFSMKESEYRNRANEIQKEMASIKDKSSQQYKSLKSNYNESIRGANEMKQAQLEIETITNDQNYFVFREAELNSGEGGILSAKENKDGRTSTIYINYVIGQDSKEHETKHAFQFIKGFLIPDYTAKYPSGETSMFSIMTTDVFQPEREAHVRNYFLNKKMMVSERYPIINSNSITNCYLYSIGYNKTRNYPKPNNCK